ncbi:MAG: hypothetical protein GY774_36245 [Planctomycetes bacterium]|nr:hypothetical protein [Planctomycetota bacterium]
MNYDAHFTDRCECGEPAVILVKKWRTRLYSRAIRVNEEVPSCLKCYAKKKANEPMIEVRND